MSVVVRHADVASFAAAARPLLLADEARHALMLGHTLNLERGVFAANDAYLATMREGERVVGAALRLPARDLVISDADESVVAALASDLRALGALPGVHAPSDTARSFADAWQRETGDLVEKTMTMSMQACAQVVPPARRAPGALRVAIEADLDLVAAWNEAFAEEARLPSGADRRANALRHIVARSAHLWIVDETPVTMAVVTGETPTGARIGGVFTPRASRGRGYATACVAALTQRLLDSGKRRCFLYTDVSNPTSNGIYRRLGYLPVAEFEEWHFREG